MSDTDVSFSYDENVNNPATLSKEQIENVYAHIPTLRGLFVAQENFCNVALELYPSCGLTLSNLKATLDSRYDGVKYVDDFRQSDDDEPAQVFRLNPNKVQRVSKLRKSLRDAITAAANTAGEAALVDIARVDPSLTPLLVDLNFGSLLDAFKSQPQFFSIRYGNVEAGEPFALVKIANARQEEATDALSDDIAGCVKELKMALVDVIRSCQDGDNNWVAAGKVGVPVVREILARMGGMKLGVAVERYLSDVVELGNQVPGDPGSAPMIRLRNNKDVSVVSPRAATTDIPAADAGQQEAVMALADLLDSILPQPSGEDTDWMMLAQVGGAVVTEALRHVADGIKLREAVQRFLSHRYDIINIAPEGMPGVWKIRRKISGSLVSVPVRVQKAVKKPAEKMTAFEKLMAFAYFHGTKENPRDGYNFAVRKLAAKALPEPWHFGHSRIENYAILKNYLQLTFERLLFEDEKNKNNPQWKSKIRVTQDGKYCIFNTGLVDRIYDPVYAFFIRNDRPGKQKWFFIDFVGSLDSNMQNITREFGTDLPEPAHYYNSTLDLVFNVKWTIGSFNWPHIIDRCDRMPEQFLVENISWLDQTRVNGRIDYRLLASRIKADGMVLNRLKNRITDAVEMALKRVKWNFRTAIPIYYPDRRQISLLLPLSLDSAPGTSVPDVALVLEATPSEAYIAHTILTLDMAYTNARLITRPDNDWLAASHITARRPWIADDGAFGDGDTGLDVSVESVIAEIEAAVRRDTVDFTQSI